MSITNNPNKLKPRVKVKIFISIYLTVVTVFSVLALFPWVFDSVHKNTKKTLYVGLGQLFCLI